MRTHKNLAQSRWLASGAALVVVIAIACAAGPFARADRWTAGEVETLRSLWIGSLQPIPPDPSNRWADDTAAVVLGYRLFFDARLSANGRVSCASCHDPARDFQDGAALATGVGATDRRTMPVAGMAHSPWQFWDGRKDSQWSQALGPLESPVEHGGTRAQYAHVIAEHYRDEYEAVFGVLPDLRGVPHVAGPVADSSARAAWNTLAPEQRNAVTLVFVNIGKAIAAYERRIGFGASRFDAYVGQLLREGRAPQGVLTADEVAGLRLFIGPANCLQCHNGPLFTNFDFHNTGVSAAPGLPRDVGRAAGAAQVLADEFNCRSDYSDASQDNCRELEFVVTGGAQLVRAYKTPTLRNVAERPPYMHAGQISSLRAVLDHYNRAPTAPEGTSELRRLRLSARQLAQLEAYLRTLSAPLDAPAGLLRSPHSW